MPRMTAGTPSPSPVTEFPMLRRIILAALIAGVLSGLVTSALQQVLINPLLVDAEAYELAASEVGLAHDHDQRSFSSLERPFLTTLFNVLAGFGFALLLNAALAVYRTHTSVEPRMRAGLVWGAAGFLSFSLAPALGLFPALPGAVEADLVSRQIWWVTTAIMTAIGLALIASSWRGLISWRPVALVLGIALLIAPHLLGAPAPPADAVSSVPSDIGWQFAITSMAVAFVFWLVLGGASAWSQRKFVRHD
jgi:cobalt transporter subunit CbtA